MSDENDGLIDRLRDSMEGSVMWRAADTIARIQAENERLYERLGPLGLEVVMIDGTGHYVSEAVRVEIDKLRAALSPFADIGVGTNPDYEPMIRLPREAILNARAALAP